jgi:putative copper resistance protein D
MVLLLTWTHLVAAVVWIGGMMFLTLVLVPVMKTGAAGGQLRTLFRPVALRFRGVVWVSIGALVSTGLVLMSQRVASFGDLHTWPFLLKLKLCLVAAMIGVTLIHDFWLGPLVSRQMAARQNDAPPAAGLLVKLSPWLSRIGLLLGLAVLLAAVVLART